MGLLQLELDFFFLHPIFKTDNSKVTFTKGKMVILKIMGAVRNYKVQIEKAVEFEWSSPNILDHL